jgi:putative transposase
VGERVPARVALLQELLLVVRSFDQGLTDRLVFDDGEALQNTRLLRKKLDALSLLQQGRSKCKRGSRRFKALNAKVAKLHRDVANQRKDELHKLSSKLVSQCEVLATEELTLSNMTRAPKPRPELDASGAPTGHFLPNGAAAKAGLNRELLSSGMGFLLQLLKYKA